MHHVFYHTIPPSAAVASAQLQPISENHRNVDVLGYGLAWYLLCVPMPLLAAAVRDTAGPLVRQLLVFLRAANGVITF